jgi:unspecific monooxygenase
VVAEQRAANREDQGPRDLFDLLIAARDPETSEAFTDDNLVDQVSNIIMAGHETTATALFWSLFLLAQDSASQEEVAREARATADLDLGALKFTRAVLDETMRLYPPSFIISRSAAGSDMVNGNSVKKGDVIVVSPWLLHRHHSFWSNPHAFMPERFMSQKAPERFTYLPFGVGPRVCVGANFALTEATLALAKIVAHFRIELLGTRPVIPIGLITTRPDHSPMFRLTRR